MTFYLPRSKAKNTIEKVLIRKLQTDEARDIIGFSGKTVGPSDLAKAAKK